MSSPDASEGREPASGDFVLVSLRGMFFSGEFSAIGPIGTEMFERAKRYPDERAALGSPACAHPLSTYKPQRVANFEEASRV